MNLRQQVQEKFSEKFGAAPDRIIKAPGRINLIGEHTDYNGGFVLPAAIDKAVYLAVGKSARSTVEWFAPQLDSNILINFKQIQPVKTDWANYLLGVIAQFKKVGLDIPAFNCVVLSDIPIGGGMSSSAALTAAAAIAVNTLGNYKIDKLQLAKFCQAAEHEYAGVNCGIMDMFATLFGKKDHVIRLDCRSLAYEYFPLQIPGYSLVLFDTGIKHSLAAGEYNLRRQYCEEGISILKKYLPGIKLLRDVPMGEFQKYTGEMTDAVCNSCLYVIDEIQRTLDACEDLKQDNITAFGKKMFATHDGLSNLYSVSCAELDFLVNAVRGNENIAGARMMGGGFGGCTINLVKEEAVQDLFQDLQGMYFDKTGIPLKMYIVKARDGAGVL